MATLSRSQILKCVAKVESTYGTDPTPAGGTDDALLVESATPVQLNVGVVDLRSHTGSFTRRVSIPTTRLYDVNCSWYVQGSGALGATANGWAGHGALIQAAAVTQTISAGTSITWAPSTIAALKSVTAYFYMDGVRYVVKGLVGTVSLSGRANDGVRCNFRGQGLYAAPDTTDISGYTGGTDRAQAFIGATITLTRSGGSPYNAAGGLVFEGFQFDTGTVVTPVMDATEATGIDTLLVTDRAERLRVDIALDANGSAAKTFAHWHTDALSQTWDVYSIKWGSGTGKVIEIIVGDANGGALVERVQTSGTDYRRLSAESRICNTANEAQWSIVIDSA